MNTSSGHGGAQWRAVVARCHLGIALLTAGAILSTAALTAGLTSSAPASPLALRVLGPPPVPLVFADKPVSDSSPPVAMTIPAIAVSSTLEGLRLNGDGSLQTPRDPNRAGWYSDGPAPGDQGAAVVVGHLDSKTGPAVFWRLAGLLRGDRIFIRRADGRTLTFVVDHSSVFPRTNLPTAAVFGANRPELHLITCNGTWEPAIGRYDHSLVVFARLADAASPTPAAPPSPAATSGSSGSAHPQGGGLNPTRPRTAGGVGAQAGPLESSGPSPTPTPTPSPTPSPSPTPAPSPTPSPPPTPSPTPSPTPDPVPIPLPSPTPPMNSSQPAGTAS